MMPDHHVTFALYPVGFDSFCDEVDAYSAFRRAEEGTVVGGGDVERKGGSDMMFGVSWVGCQQRKPEDSQIIAADGASRIIFTIIVLVIFRCNGCRPGPLQNNGCCCDRSRRLFNAWPG